MELFILSSNPLDFHFHDPREHIGIWDAVGRRDGEKASRLARPMSNRLPGTK